LAGDEFFQEAPRIGTGEPNVLQAALGQSRSREQNILAFDLNAEKIGRWPTPGCVQQEETFAAAGLDLYPAIGPQYTWSCYGRGFRAGARIGREARRLSFKEKRLERLKRQTSTAAQRSSLVFVERNAYDVAVKNHCRAYKALDIEDSLPPMKFDGAGNEQEA